MALPVPDMWPQIVTAIAVSTCSAIVTILVQKTTKKLENVATKDFVTGQLSWHGEQLEKRIGEMFVRASTQQIVNADVEARVRRVETAFGIKLENWVKTATGEGGV